MNCTAPIAAPLGMRRRTALAATLLLPTAGFAQAPARPLDVPYVPTRMPIVQKMLELGRVGRKDMLYDLGCGDGRIVITAAKERGARGVGIDIDPQRIAEAKANAQEAGVTDRTRFSNGDLLLGHALGRRVVDDVLAEHRRGEAVADVVDEPVHSRAAGIE